MIYSPFFLVTSTPYQATLLEIVDDAGGAGGDDIDIVAAAEGNCANAAWDRSE